MEWKNPDEGCIHLTSTSITLDYPKRRPSRRATQTSPSAPFRSCHDTPRASSTRSERGLLGVGVRTERGVLHDFLEEALGRHYAAHLLAHLLPTLLLLALRHILAVLEVPSPKALFAHQLNLPSTSNFHWLHSNGAPEITLKQTGGQIMLMSK